MRSSTDAHPHTHVQYIVGILCDLQFFPHAFYKSQSSKLNFTNKLNNRESERLVVGNLCLEPLTFCSVTG